MRRFLIVGEMSFWTGQKREEVLKKVVFNQLLERTAWYGFL